MDHELTKSRGFLCLDFKTQLKARLSPSRDESCLEAELGLGLRGGEGWKILFQIHKLPLCIIYHWLTLHETQSLYGKALPGSSPLGVVSYCLLGCRALPRGEVLQC